MQAQGEKPRKVKPRAKASGATAAQATRGRGSGRSRGRRERGKEGHALRQAAAARATLRDKRCRHCQSLSTEGVAKKQIAVHGSAPRCEYFFVVKFPHYN